MFQKYFCSLSAQTQKGKHTMQSSSKHWNRLNGSTARFPRKAFWQRALYLVFVCTVLSISYNAWANRFLYFALKLMQAEQVTVIDCTPPVRLTDQQWDDLIGSGILAADPQTQPLQAVTQQHTVCVTLQSGKIYTMQIGVLDKEPVLLTAQQVYLCTGGNPDIISSWDPLTIPPIPQPPPAYYKHVEGWRSQT